jgi:hypothetical protein
MLGSIGLQLVNPQIMRGFIDAALGGVAPLQTLTISALAFIVIALVQQGVAISVTYLGENVAWTATNALRAELAWHVGSNEPLPSERVGEAIDAYLELLGRFRREHHGEDLSPVISTAARAIVRVNELFECYRVIRAVLEHMPEGELTTRIPRKIPAGETISRVEAPRGELFYYVKSNGSENPERVKIRTPTLPNFASVLELAVGRQLADIPMILAGIDPCFSCNDRMVSINDTRGSDRFWTWEQLRQYGIEAYR